MKFKMPSKNKPIYEVPVQVPTPSFMGEDDSITMYVTVTMSSFNFNNNEVVGFVPSSEPKNQQNISRYLNLPEEHRLPLQVMIAKTIKHFVG